MNAALSSPWRAWLVDLDGTLYRPRPVQLAMALELMLSGWSALPKIRAFRRAHETLRHAEGVQPPAGSSPYHRQMALAAEQLNVPVAALQATVEHWMIERPGRWLKLFCRHALVAELRHFRQQGGRCALVSDYPASKKLKALGLDDFFEVVIANGESAQLGALKPDPAGYLAAATALGVDAQECLVIGDRQDADGLAAARAGMSFRKIG